MPSREWADATDEDLAAIARTGIPAYDPWRDAGECQFDAEAARRVLRFFRGHLKLIEGETAGEPFTLEDWQVAIIANLFGWYRPDGMRRYRSAFVLIPRKNGKTPLAAAIALYLLVRDNEPGAQVYSAAGELTQAALLYRHAAGMVRADPKLASVLRPYDTFKSIEYGATSSFFRSLSADARTKHGQNAHGVVIDELHVHPNAELVNVLTKSTSSRRQPMTVYITTADFERDSICNTLHDYSRKVRDGIASSPEWLPVLYEASPTDDWQDEAVWRKCNPNLGVSKKIEYMREECRKADAIPALRNEFLRLDLNVRTGLESVLIDPAKWAACAGAVPYDEMAKSLVGSPCFGGFDLATKNDLIAFVLFFPNDCAVLCWLWAPAEGARERALRDRAPYIDWALRTPEGDASPGLASILPWESSGFLRLTDGNVADYAVVEQDVMRLCETYRPKVVNYDRWNAEATVQRLIAAGVTMAPMGQGFASMTAPTKEIVERLVPAGLLRHGGHPALAWMASHVQGERDPAGNLKFSKSKSRERIDGLVALAMAVGGSQVTPVAPKPFVPMVMHIGGDRRDE